MKWDLPTSVEIDGKEYAIRNKCDYRVVLDVISALNDDELDDRAKCQCALIIFYEDLSECEDLQTALDEMMQIINSGEEDEPTEQKKPPIMDWEHDFPNLAPPISRVLGYSVRDANHYTHWWDFVGAYKEIGECAFSTIVSIRQKRAKGQKLENWEQEFLNEHRKMVELPRKLTKEESEWLDADW